MMARLHNFGLLLFKPVVVDDLFLKKVAPLPGEDAVDICMVDDPCASLNSGSTVGRRDLALLIRPDEHEHIEHNGNTLPASFRSDHEAIETWENEGGQIRNGG
jgi:hypothetical protein